MPQIKKPLLVIVHGGDSYSQSSEFIAAIDKYPPRLKGGLHSPNWKTHLEQQVQDYYQTFYPQLPSADNADYKLWKKVFEKGAFNPSVLIGHSLGGNFLIKYLLETELSFKIAQLHLIAACYDEGNFAISTKDWSTIEKKCNNVFIWQSLDDRIVPAATALYLKDRLPKSRLLLMDGKGHFNQSFFPEILRFLLPNI
jgi:uncharacterized protein